MAKVGEEIESVCGKCGDVWHVVAAMIGPKVVKVVCKRCGTQHRHRPPAVAGAAGPSETKIAAPAKEKSARSSKAKGAAPANAAARVEADLSKPIRPYRAADVYKPRERIEHRTFGLGVVEDLAGAGKIHVRFTDGVKMLLHGATPAP